MNVELLGKILGLLLEAVKLGIQFGPKVVEDLRLLWTILVREEPLTEEQIKFADEVLARASLNFDLAVNKAIREDAENGRI